MVEDFQEKVVALLDVVGGWIGARTLFFKTSTKKTYTYKWSSEDLGIYISMCLLTEL